jgi:hypothetical protein
VTALEAYELTTQGGATDFVRVIDAFKSFGPYCLIGGLAVNCFVEPVYTLDADLVVIASNLPKLAAYLQQQGFKTGFSFIACGITSRSASIRAPITSIRASGVAA